MQYDYGTMLINSHQFYRSQWIGTLPADYDISWRSDAFTTEVGPTTLDWGDITGGVMEGATAGGHFPFQLVPFACQQVPFVMLHSAE